MGFRFLTVFRFRCLEGSGGHGAFLLKLSLFPKAEVSEHALWPVLLAAEQKGMKCKRQQLLGEILLPWTSQAFEYQVTSGAL